MTAVRLPDVEPRSPAWYAARQGRIGGSDVGVLMGWSPYKTPEDLAAEKKGGEADDRRTPARGRGRYCEPAICAWLDDRLRGNGKGSAERSEGEMYAAADEPWMLYSPDGWVLPLENGEPWPGPVAALAELKTCDVRDAEHGWGRAGTAAVPLAYAAQCQWGMGIMGLPETLLAVLSGAPRFEFALYRIPFDPAAFAYLKAQARAFLTRHDITPGGHP